MIQYIVMGILIANPELVRADKILQHVDMLGCLDEKIVVGLPKTLGSQLPHSGLHIHVQYLQ